MLSLSAIVQVQVNAASAVSPVSAFSTGLILAPSSSQSIPQSSRLRLYANAADMLTDGFTAISGSAPWSERTIRGRWRKSSADATGLTPR